MDALIAASAFLPAFFVDNEVMIPYLNDTSGCSGADLEASFLGILRPSCISSKSMCATDRLRDRCQQYRSPARSALRLCGALARGFGGLVRGLYVKTSDFK